MHLLALEVLQFLVSRLSQCGLFDLGIPFVVCSSNLEQTCTPFWVFPLFIFRPFLPLSWRWIHLERVGTLQGRRRPSQLLQCRYRAKQPASSCAGEPFAEKTRQSEVWMSSRSFPFRPSVISFSRAACLATAVYSCRRGWSGPGRATLRNAWRRTGLWRSETRLLKHQSRVSSHLYWLDAQVAH